MEHHQENNQAMLWCWEPEAVKPYPSWNSKNGKGANVWVNNWFLLYADNCIKVSELRVWKNHGILISGRCWQNGTHLEKPYNLHTPSTTPCTLHLFHVAIHMYVCMYFYVHIVCTYVCIFNVHMYVFLMSFRINRKFWWSVSLSAMSLSINWLNIRRLILDHLSIQNRSSLWN